MAAESQRQQDARRRLEMAQAAARADAAAAQQKLDDFVARLKAAGAEPEPLQAALLNGNRVRTNLVGWYLNKSQSIAVTPDGTYYQLTTPGSALARWRGVKPTPSAPSMLIGYGGRDGETGDLVEFLDRAFAEYTSR